MQLNNWHGTSKTRKCMYYQQEKKRKESRKINVPISDNLHSTTIAQLSVYIKLRLRKIALSVYKKLRLGKIARILLKQLRKTRKFRNRFDFEKIYQKPVSKQNSYQVTANSERAVCSKGDSLVL